MDTLSGPGPFTVFAPTNEAFAMLPPGTVPTLLKPENKATLTKVLTYHVVAGSMDSKTLMAAIVAGGGRATLTTVAGLPLTATMGGPGTIMLTDAKGRGGDRHHRGRVPVERRHPRDRPRAVAGLNG